LEYAAYINPGPDLSPLPSEGHHGRTHHDERDDDGEAHGSHRASSRGDPSHRGADHGQAEQSVADSPAEFVVLVRPVAPGPAPQDEDRHEAVR
jgi:hypothetical protein